MFGFVLGAKVGAMTISLSWTERTDLDLYVTLPSGEEINYTNKKSACGSAELDIDMNASAPYSAEPVENMFLLSIMLHGHGTEMRGWS